MALNFPSPTVCFSLAYSPPLPHDTSRHAVHLQSSSTLLFFFIAYPLLHVSLSVCLSSPPPLLPLTSLTIWTFPILHGPPRPPLLQPRAPSPTSPDELPMNVKQAYKAFAAVPRSLAVLEPPQVGRAAWTQLCHNDSSMLCWLVGLALPPSWLEQAILYKACTTLGGLWRAVTCGMRSSLAFCTPVQSSVMLVFTLDPFFHPCVAHVLILSPLFHVLYPSS